MSHSVSVVKKRTPVDTERMSLRNDQTGECDCCWAEISMQDAMFQHLHRKADHVGSKIALASCSLPANSDGDIFWRRFFNSIEYRSKLAKATHLRGYPDS